MDRTATGCLIAGEDGVPELDHLPRPRGKPTAAQPTPGDCGEHRNKTGLDGTGESVSPVHLICSQRQTLSQESQPPALIHYAATMLPNFEFPPLGR